METPESTMILHAQNFRGLVFACIEADIRRHTFARFSEIYKICTPLERSNLTDFLKFRHIFVIFLKHIAIFGIISIDNLCTKSLTLRNDFDDHISEYDKLLMNSMYDVAQTF